MPTRTGLRVATRAILLTVCDDVGGAWTRNSYFQLWLSCQVAVLRGRMVWSGCWSGADPEMPAEIRDAAFARMQTCARATKAERLALLALFWCACPTAKKSCKEKFFRGISVQLPDLSQVA